MRLRLMVLQFRVESLVVKVASKLKTFFLLDVIPLSLGVETIGKKRDKVIPRNTTIPARRHGIFTTTEDNQTIVDFMVFEGESSSTKDCHKLGQFQLTGIQCAPKGVPKLEVTFEIDANGKLNVRAVDKATKNSASIVIKTTKEGA